MKDTILEVKNLRTSFKTDDGWITAVNGIDFTVEAGKTLCIVGESGCGKSVTALSLLQLIPSATSQIDPKGSVVFEGKNLLELSREEMRKIRGRDIAMIFQEPMTALNPVYTCGDQIAEVFRIHHGLSRREARGRALEMLEKVQIPSPKQRLDEYPHQMSGGMKQRVMIAMALACNPKVLIADEPTTALDVTVQAQILKLMKELQQTTGTALVFITHDLGVVAEIADEVMVMYAGEVIEKSSVYDIFERPAHPYTQGLLKSIPTIDSPRKSPLFMIDGMVPGLNQLPVGCNYQDRCQSKKEICKSQSPQLSALSDQHLAACHFAHEEARV